jgi:hypothetical protein
LKLIPTGVPVSATNRIGAHLSERKRIFSFPVRREARWIIVDVRHPSWRDFADKPDKFKRALHNLQADPAWRRVFARSGILIFRRESSAG